MKKMYAVIFRTKRKLPSPEEYTLLSRKLSELAANQKDFIRIESVVDTNGYGISISYWSSLESIKTWKENSLHIEAQHKGKTIWYENYNVEICEILYSYNSSSSKIY